MDVSSGTNSAELLTGAVDRVLSERRALKKRAIKKANAKTYKRVNRSPETSRLKFTDEGRADPAARKIGHSYRHMKFNPYHAAAKAEEKAFKANVNTLYERSLRLNPELEHANPLNLHLP